MPHASSLSGEVQSSSNSGPSNLIVQPGELTGSKECVCT